MLPGGRLQRFAHWFHPENELLQNIFADDESRFPPESMRSPSWYTFLEEVGMRPKDLIDLSSFERMNDIGEGLGKTLLIT